MFPTVEDLDSFLLNDVGTDIDELLVEGNSDNYGSSGKEEERMPDQIDNQKLCGSHRIRSVWRMDNQGWVKTLWWQ